MNKIHILILLGIGLMVVGAYWMILNPEVESIEGDYWLDDKPYLILMQVGWNVWGTIVFLLGLFSALAGFAKSSEVEG